ncbi:hypothetical protein ACFLZ8_02490 [Planctomycetota bacterium]
MTNEKLYTIGELADLFEEPPSRVSYITRKLRIKPETRVGTFRLFGKRQIKLIKSGLYNLQVRGQQ